MIIFPGGPDRSRNVTRLPFAAPLAQRSADASRTGPSVPGAKRSRGFAGRFDLVEFETDARAHLDDLAADSSLDPDAFRRKAATDIGQMAEQRFDPAGDRALGAGTLPGYRQALDRLQGVTKELTEDLRARDAAARVFDTTVRVLKLPDDGPADRLQLFERAVDAVDDLALTPDQKVQVRTAIAARVLSERKADLLQGRHAGLKGPGERLLAELAEEQHREEDAREAHARPLHTAATLAAAPVLSVAADSAVLSVPKSAPTIRPGPLSPVARRAVRTDRQSATQEPIRHRVEQKIETES